MRRIARWRLSSCSTLVVFPACQASLECVSLPANPPGQYHRPCRERCLAACATDRCPAPASCKSPCLPTLQGGRRPVRPCRPFRTARQRPVLHARPLFHGTSPPPRGGAAPVRCTWEPCRSLRSHTSELSCRPWLGVCWGAQGARTGGQRARPLSLSRVSRKLIS